MASQKAFFKKAFFNFAQCCSENKCVQFGCKDMFCCREIKRFLAHVDITVCHVELWNKFLITLYYTLYSVFKVLVNFEEN